MGFGSWPTRSGYPKIKWADQQMLLPNPASISLVNPTAYLHSFDIIPVRWSCLGTTNFLQNLFGHHAPPARQTHSYLWPGQSGTEYSFEIHSLGMVLKPLPGVYIYAKQLADGDWSPLYISQSRDLHQRLEGHVTLRDAIANGATHLHVHYHTEHPTARFAEEHDLVQHWCPVCNDPLET